MKQLFYGICLAATLFCNVLSAQEGLSFDNAKDGEQSLEYKYWVGIVGAGSTCITTVRLDTITSVSKHTYSVEGVSFREVTIDTRGNNSIRFYACINERANTMKDRMSNTRALIDSKTDNNTKYPAKKYPEGTCSHNVEYQVENAAALNNLYNSVVNALLKNKGCTFKIK